MCPLRWWFGGYARPAGAWRKRPWLNGESTCLRSRGLQVRVLPGVLCPKQKRPMRRDVAPEEAGSSPAGHPQYGVLTHCRRYDGCVARQSPYATNAIPAALAQLGEAPGLASIHRWVGVSWLG